MAWPVVARAQQPGQARRIGVLSPFAETDPQVRANLAAFRHALHMLGWDGRSARIDYRWGDADPERIRRQAQELVAFSPDVILVSSALALQPLLQETRRIPSAAITPRHRGSPTRQGSDDWRDNRLCFG